MPDLKRHDSAMAFPGHHSHGMTLRDYFAAQALIGLIAGPKYWEEQPAELETYAVEAYAHADAMLNERKKADA